MPPCRFDVIVTAQVFKRSDFPSGMINWHCFSLRDIETVRFVSRDWWLVWATISSKPPRDQCGEICDAYCFLDGNSIEGMVPDGRIVSTSIWFTLVHKCFPTKHALRMHFHLKMSMNCSCALCIVRHVHVWLHLLYPHLPHQYQSSQKYVYIQIGCTIPVCFSCPYVPVRKFRKVNP